MGKASLPKILALASFAHSGHVANVAASSIKIIVEKHPDGYVAYPLGLARGAIVGQGDSYEDALADVRSAINFHLETFGTTLLELSEHDPVLEAFVAEAAIPA